MPLDNCFLCYCAYLIHVERSCRVFCVTKYIQSNNAANNSKVLEEYYGSATEKNSYYGDGASRIIKEEKVSNQTATLNADLKGFFVVSGSYSG